MCCKKLTTCCCSLAGSPAIAQSIKYLFCVIDRANSSGVPSCALIRASTLANWLGNMSCSMFVSKTVAKILLLSAMLTTDSVIREAEITAISAFLIEMLFSQLITSASF